ncbi:MAG: phosphotransferase [Acidimicrobiia bacterium]|nr:phosphotransferase [Acidimicrobiia bacterium]
MTVVARFPSGPEDLTPALLTQVLAIRHPGVEVATVELASVKRCGEGVASTADRVVLDLTYVDGCDGGLPGRMVLKTMLVSPHAPGEMYETEVRFYNEIRPDLDIETPGAYAAAFDPATSQFGVLLEDLTVRGARFPDATQDVTVDEVAAILTQLARLHARYWRSERFAHDLAWVATPSTGGMSGIFERHGLAIIRDQLRRHPFKAELIKPLGADLDSLWSALGVSRRILASAPETLLHGDTHIANTYLLPDGTAGLLDWQLQVRGCFAHDVIYLICTALTPVARRDEGRQLLEGYLSELAACGVADAPASDEAWVWCRRAVLWGLVIGWLITPPENYGEEITVANTERMVAAVADLDALGVLHDDQARRDWS